MVAFFYCRQILDWCEIFNARFFVLNLLERRGEKVKNHFSSFFHAIDFRRFIFGITPQKNPCDEAWRWIPSASFNEIHSWLQRFFDTSNNYRTLPENVALINYWNLCSSASFADWFFASFNPNDHVVTINGNFNLHAVNFNFPAFYICFKMSIFIALNEMESGSCFERKKINLNLIVSP